MTQIENEVSCRPARCLSRLLVSRRNSDVRPVCCVSPAVGQYGRYNRYVEWCGNLTRQLNTDTVWVMCSQPTPPPPVLGTCNGDDCSGWVQGQQALGLPAGWTEDWVAWFQHWGEGVPTRDSRDIAYDVASFFAKGGVYQNY
jgi:hypothetical protein